MSDQHGTPIWYELITPEPEAAADFYARAIGWTVGGYRGATIAGPDDYRIVTAADGEGIGGLLKQPHQGAKPGWIVYVGVDDVDASAAIVEQAGGTIQMSPTDLEGVGRMAMVSDPEGAAFYLMRGFSAASSTSFKRMAEGHGEWHELVTSDDTAAIDFYGRLFGWRKEGAMPMGPGREYSFLSHQGGIIGAVMKGGKSGWQLYFRTGAVDDAVARVNAAGGTVEEGPHQVPGGDWVIQARDPQGALFGLVGSR